MQKYLWSVVLVAMAVSLSFGVATATAAKGSNSASAKACQKGGWENLMRSPSGPGFNSEQECVSYAAQGGTLLPKPTCTAGSDNFSAYEHQSQPTTFAGGTIDTAYGPGGLVQGILIEGQSAFYGFIPDGTHMLWTGYGVDSFRLTFTTAVSSVQLDAWPANVFSHTLTLNAYDSSDGLVGTDSETTSQLATLSVSSAPNNIKYFTINTTDPDGTVFTNLVWGCAA